MGTNDIYFITGSFLTGFPEALLLSPGQETDNLHASLRAQASGTYIYLKFVPIRLIAL